MVHLTTVRHAGGDAASKAASEAATAVADATSELVGKAKTLLRVSTESDEFTTSIYGTRYATQDLPTAKMPEGQMPRDVAYRLIKDDLSLDNNPMLKYVISPSHKGLRARLPS